MIGRTLSEKVLSLFGGKKAITIMGARQAGGWMQIVLTDTVQGNGNMALMLRCQADDKGRRCRIYVNDELLKEYTVPDAPDNVDDNNFYNVELPLGTLAFGKEGTPVTHYVIRIVASDTTPTPGLYYIRLVRDSNADERKEKSKAAE